MARWYGWGMRLRLAKLLGVRRAKHWVRLLHEEYRAQDQRRGLGVSRRTVVLGALAGLVAAGASIQVAAADPRSRPDEYELLDDAQTADLLASSAAARQLVDRLGVIEYGKTKDDTGEIMFVLKHSAESASVVPASTAEVGATFTVKDQGKTLGLSLHSGEDLGSIVDLDSKPRLVEPSDQRPPVRPTATSMSLGNDMMAAPAGYVSAGYGPTESVVTVQPAGWREFRDCMLVETALDAIAIGKCVLDCTTGGSIACVACLGPKVLTQVVRCFPNITK